MTRNPEIPSAAAPSDAAAPSPHFRTIRAGTGFNLDALAAVWGRRELLYFLIWRDVRVKYKQTALGAGWAILKPLIAAAIFTAIFGHLVHVPSDGIPYPLFVLAGLVPWTYFSSAVSQTTQSLVESANLISKVAFPRIILPLAALLSFSVEMVLSFAVLIAFAVAMHHPPHLTALLAPLFLVIAILTAAAVGIWLAALNARFRDVGNVVPFVTQVWLYASPVAYPLSIAHGNLALVMAINPLTGVVEGFRWSLFGQGVLNVPAFVISETVTLALLLTGTVYFSRVERQFADVV